MPRALTAAVLLLCACGDRSSTTRVDPWYTGVPEGIGPFSSGAVQLDGSCVREVTAAGLAEAVKLLETDPCVEIDPERTGELAGRTPAGPRDASPFLVRGVYLNKATGGFVVRVKGPELLVHHGCLGRTPLPMKRQPLVVYLHAKPGKVFVTCSMDE